jgi:hypothetical protein
MSKRKLLYLIPIATFLLVAGVSLLLANSGHFKILADALHMSADQTPVSYPTMIQVAKAGSDDANGPYYACGQIDKEPAYYKSIVNGAGQSGFYIYWDSGASRWVIQYGPTGLGYYTSNTTVGIPISSSSTWGQVLSDTGIASYAGALPAPSTTALAYGGKDCTVPTLNFEVDGVVENSSNQNFIVGAKVIINGKSGSTDSSGNFKITGIPISSNANMTAYTINIDETGITPKNPTYKPFAQTNLSNYGVSDIPANGLINLMGSYGVFNQPIYLNPIPATFNLRGEVFDENFATTNKNHNPLQGVNITVYDNSSASTAKPIGTAVSGILKTAKSGKLYNYEIANIPQADFGNLTVTFTTANNVYVLDSVLDADGKTWSNVVNKSISFKASDLSFDSQENLYIAYKNVKMKQTSFSSFTLFGKITDKGDKRVLGWTTIDVYPNAATKPQYTTTSTDVSYLDTTISTDPYDNSMMENYEIKNIPTTADLGYGLTGSSFPMTIIFSRNGYAEQKIKIAASDVQQISGAVGAYVHKDVAMASNCPAK